MSVKIDQTNFRARKPKFTQLFLIKGPKCFEQGIARPHTPTHVIWSRCGAMPWASKSMGHRKLPFWMAALLFYCEPKRALSYFVPLVGLLLWREPTILLVASPLVAHGSWKLRLLFRGWPCERSFRGPLE